MTTDPHIKNEKEIPVTKQAATNQEPVAAAHEQADKDISNDPELSIHSPNDDLDEGETARLGDDENDLI